MKQNLADMGLAFDANQIQKVQGGARALVEKRKRAAKGARGEEDEEEEAQEAGPSSEVVQKLEEEVSRESTGELTCRIVRIFVLRKLIISQIKRTRGGCSGMVQHTFSLNLQAKPQLQTPLASIRVLPVHFL